MIKTKIEYIYDTKFYRRYKLEYNYVTKEVISINKNDYRNTLYFYENYGTVDNQTKDIIWMTDDGYVVEINDSIFDLAKNINFFKTLKTLKTYDRIINYIKYLIL